MVLHKIKPSVNLKANFKLVFSEVQRTIPYQYRDLAFISEGI